MDFLLLVVFFCLILNQIHSVYHITSILILRHSISAFALIIPPIVLRRGACNWVFLCVQDTPLTPCKPYGYGWNVFTYNEYTWITRGKSLNSTKSACASIKIPLFGTSVYFKIFYLAHVPCKTDVKDLAHSSFHKQLLKTHTKETHELQKRLILVSFAEILAYSSYIATCTKSHPKITKLNCPIKVQTKDFYILSISFLALPCFSGCWDSLNFSAPLVHKWDTAYCLFH